MSADAVETLVQLLFPIADLVTPNLPEAAALLGEGLAADESAMARQGEKLMRLGARAVLIKGGHGSGAESVDLLIDETGVARHAAARVATAQHAWDRLHALFGDRGGPREGAKPA